MSGAGRRLGVRRTCRAVRPLGSAGMASVPPSALASAFCSAAPAAASAARVLARVGRRRRDVGGDVLGVLARSRASAGIGASFLAGRRIDRRVLVGLEDLAVHDALVGRAAEPVVARTAATPRRGSARRRPWRRRARACGTRAHLPTNSVLPLTRLSPSSLSSQPVSETSATPARSAVRTHPPIMARDPTCWSGGAASGPREAVEAPFGGGDHGARDAVPGVALARDADDRVARAGAQPGGRLEPGREPFGELRAPRAGPTSNVSHGRTSGGAAAASARATSAMPEWPATTGSAPHAAASAATIPNASGKVLGIAIASATGSTSVSSSCSSRPAQCTRAAMPSAAARYAAASGPSASRNAASSGSSRPSSPAQRRGPRRGRRARARRRAPPAPPGTRRSRRRAAARPARAPSTSGQAASSSSTPLEAISLPT